eukprot:2174289-Amphidinium_carterae.1
MKSSTLCSKASPAAEGVLTCMQQPYESATSLRSQYAVCQSAVRLQERAMEFDSIRIEAMTIKLRSMPHICMNCAQRPYNLFWFTWVKLAFQLRRASACLGRLLVQPHKADPKCGTQSSIQGSKPI